MSGLTKIEVTTTSVHAEMVLKAAVSELKSHVAYLRRVQGDQLAADNFGAARYSGGQIDRALLGAFEAQHLLTKLIPQGEEEHGNEV